MLSQQAWNAFLKTLEEPPPRTIFVLATTEAQKVLPTVVDRCHRFDFGRPTVEQVARVLNRVAASEQIAIEPGAVALIARHATGSFRDALGTLEQLLTYAGDEQITAADVLAVLGVADAEQLFEAIDAVIAHDPAAGAARRGPASWLRTRPRAGDPRPRDPRPRAARRPGARGGPRGAARDARARRAAARPSPGAAWSRGRCACSSSSPPRSRRPRTAPSRGSSSSWC